MARAAPTLALCVLVVLACTSLVSSLLHGPGFRRALETPEGLQDNATVKEGGEWDADGGSEDDVVAEIEEGETEAVPGPSIEMYDGVRLIVHPDSEVEVNGTGDWIITIPSGCATADVQRMAAQMPNGTVGEFLGNPDAGGLCAFIMTGTKNQVKEGLAKHSWSSAPIVETDMTWYVVPEIPETVPGFDEDVAKSRHESTKQDVAWGLDRIDAMKGQDKSYSPASAYHEGEGVHVFVADTGIMTTHADFGGRAIPTIEVLANDAPLVVCQPGDVSCALDMNGHGTRCAGVVGGSTWGVAKKATLHSVKILADEGSGMFSWLIQAVDWALQAKAANRYPAVFSASLGGTGRYESVKAAIDQAVDSGVTFVVAAGDEGATRDPDACQYSPGYVDKAITVGAVDSRDGRAYYSNYGGCVDIFAPGSKVQSAGIDSESDSAAWSGTSLACPHVAGAAALLLAEDSNRTPADVMRVMIARATAGALQDVKTSPNRLLYTGPFSADLAPPAPTAAPVASVPQAWLPPVTTRPPSMTRPPQQPSTSKRSSASYMCSFEEKDYFRQCWMWATAATAQENEVKWRQASGTTPTQGTGPESALHGKYYLYVDNSQPVNSKATLESNPVFFSRATRIRFGFHMHGKNRSKLQIWVGETLVFQRTGNQGKRWRVATINLGRFHRQTERFRFVVLTGGEKGDIAIDRVEIIRPGAIIWR